MLELQGLSSGYGAIEALKSIDMRIDKGEIVTLIGANGAGKSTTLRSITGLVIPAGGQVLFEGRNLNGMPTHQITALGISMSGQPYGICKRATAYTGHQATRGNTVVDEPLQKLHSFSRRQRIRFRVCSEHGEAGIL